MWDMYGYTRAGGPTWGFLVRAYYERRMKETTGWLRRHYQSIVESVVTPECGC